MFVRDLTRGGQTNLHDLLMLKQIFKAAFITSFILSLLSFGYFVSKEVTVNNLLMVVDYKIAEVKSLITRSDIDQRKATKHKLLSRKNIALPPKQILKNKNFKRNYHRFFKVIKSEAVTSLMLMPAYLISIILAWILIGKKARGSRIERGASFVSPRRLLKILKRKRKNSDFTLCEFEEGFRKYKLPFLKDAEKTHTLITGTTGAGKTNCMKGILSELRRKNQKCLVIDITGEFISGFYREGKDYILNPFDKRTEKWTLWSDAKRYEEFDQLASSLFEANSFSDPFWNESAKSLFSSTLVKLDREGQKSIKKLISNLILLDFKEAAELYKDTPAASLFDPNNEKTSSSIRSTIASKIKSLDVLEDIKTSDSFSVKEWISKKDDSWLFISSSPTQRDTLTPLISVWLDQAINGLMEKGISKDVTWFIIDELAGLDKVSGLPKLLAESRKYGGAVVTATQNLPQLYSIYRADITKSLIDLFGTKIIFRTTESETGEQLSRMFGFQEITEKTENKSYGANSIRDGVSISEHSKNKPIITATEISLLEDLTCYIKYPENYPVTKLKMGYTDIPYITTSFDKQEIGSIIFETAKQENTSPEDAALVKQVKELVSKKKNCKRKKQKKKASENKKSKKNLIEKELLNETR